MSKKKGVKADNRDIVRYHENLEGDEFENGLHILFPKHFNVFCERKDDVIIDFFLDYKFLHSENAIENRALFKEGYKFNIISGFAPHSDFRGYFEEEWKTGLIVTEVKPFKVLLQGRAISVWVSEKLLDQEETFDLSRDLGFLDKLDMAQACVRTESDEFLGYLIYFK